jgi:hypothetical protein
MKKCSYCGAEYPDDTAMCALDHTPFECPAESPKSVVESIGEFVIVGVGRFLGILFLLFVGVFMVVWALDLDRSRDFRSKMREARPLVEAIERFRNGTAVYPQSLDELVPKYSSGIATNVKNLRQKFSGWEYYLNTNDGKVSYTLENYNMGRAGIEYTPPYWTGNVDGSRRVLREGL